LTKKNEKILLCSGIQLNVKVKDLPDSFGRAEPFSGSAKTMQNKLAGAQGGSCPTRTLFIYSIMIEDEYFKRR